MAFSQTFGIASGPARVRGTLGLVMLAGTTHVRISTTTFARTPRVCWHPDRELPPDQINRHHDGIIVRVQPFIADRFAFDVVHACVDAAHSRRVP